MSLFLGCEGRIFVNIPEISFKGKKVRGGRELGHVFR
jgi:hypothetical protein